MNSLWLRKTSNPPAAGKLAEELGLSEVLASLLCMRGYSDSESAQRFLSPSLDQLHDPALMLGMNRAVERISKALANNEKILIYGDYDVDGTTGTVLLRRGLELLAGKTDFHVPHRFTEGYGIQREVLEKAKARGVSLVVSVDCGIRAFEPLIWARENGLDVIITDHHLPDEGEGVPPALVVLNPNQAGCDYPDKNLAGVGVAFKLIHALFRNFNRENLIRGFLKIAAIGTVADVAKLVGENRVIVSLGLADLHRATNHGLRALMEVSGCGDGGNISATDLGFRLGPRINAAGRMDSARTVVELFEAPSMVEARRLALELDARNRERQRVQQEIVRLAIAEVNNRGDDPSGSYVTIISGDDWHQGVIGIAASKIAEKLCRPCLVISFDGDVGHGSGRSIEAYHLLDGLTACSHLFEKFGGHSHAAGLTIKRDNLQALRLALNKHASEKLTSDDLRPAFEVDMELSAEQLSPALMFELAKMEPFGAGNPRPVFFTKNLRLASAPRHLKERHLKIRVAGSNNRTYDGIWWDGIEKSGGRTFETGEGIEAAYTMESNFWQGITQMQLSLRDIR